MSELRGTRGASENSGDLRETQESSEELGAAHSGEIQGIRESSEKRSSGELLGTHESFGELGERREISEKLRGTRRSFEEPGEAPG